MNRLHSINVRDVTISSLPPQSPGNAVRMLFINANQLGHRTQAAAIRQATEGRLDVDAVHIDIERPLWVKLATGSYRLPQGFDMSDYRYLTVYGTVVRRWLRGVLDIRRFDVIQFLTQGLSGAALCLGSSTNAAVVLNIDSTGVASLREFGGWRIPRVPFIANERRLLKRAQLVCSWSDWVARSVVSDYGVDPDRVAVHRNGVVVPEVAHCGKASGIARIVFVGNDWRRKGGDLLLKIHQESLASRAELHVVSSSERPAGKYYNLVWHGSVDHRRLTEELLPSMDVFAFPTRQDMSPFVVLEAAAAGLPVVATRVGAISEMVVEGVSGFLTNPGDTESFTRSLASLIVDVERRREMGIRGRAHVLRHYDMAVNYPRLVDQLVDLGRRHRDTWASESS